MADKKDMKLESIDINKPIEIFQVGNWKGGDYTEKDIDECIENFENKVCETYLTIDHNPGLTKTTKDFFKAMSLGYVSKLWRDGKKLMANFKQVPKLIAELIDAGALKKRSVEYWLKFKHANGKVYTNVLQGVTFHGANGLPALSTLGDIPKLFKDCAEIESIDNENLISVETNGNIDFKQPKQEANNMDNIQVPKNEYDELLSFKHTVTKLEMDVESFKTANETLQTKLDEVNTELKEFKSEKESFETEKEEFKKTQEKLVSTEADTFVAKLIEDKKLLPKYKEMKVADYIRLKNDEAGLKLFKEELETRGDVVDMKGVTKNSNGDTVKKGNIDFKSEKDVIENSQADWDNTEASIQAHMKANSCSYEKAGVELGFFDRSEVEADDLN